MVRVIAADGDAMLMFGDDLAELLGTLGEAGHVSDQHQVRVTGSDSGEYLPTPLRRTGADCHLRHCVNRDHSGTVAPVLQLPNLPVELVTTM
jgi:hypothetical protein